MMLPPPPSSTLFPYTTLFRSLSRSRDPASAYAQSEADFFHGRVSVGRNLDLLGFVRCVHGKFSLQADAEKKDRKSTRLNSSHSQISYAVFCLKKKSDLTTG